MKSKDLQPKLLYPARLAFKIKEVKNFPNEKKLREFVTTKPVLQQMLKGQLEEEEEEEEERKRKDEEEEEEEEEDEEEEKGTQLKE